MSSFEPAHADISMEYYLECRIKRHHTYTVLVVGFICMLVTLPFVTLDVSVNCSGILKPAAEPSLLKALATGLIAKVHVKENTAVKRGALLFEISSHELQERQHYLRDQISETSELLRDVDLLMTASNDGNSLAQPRSTLTNLYRQVFADYAHRLNLSRAKLEKISREYSRNKILFDGDVISAVDMENSQFEWSRARDEVQSIIETQLTSWERQSLEYKVKLNELQNQLNNVEQEMESLNIVAPIAGSIQGLSGVYPGSYVLTNQAVCYISPDTTLIAEIYVPPYDIGQVRKGMSVRVQVTAYDYNQWGMVQAHVRQISDDVSVVDGKPFFKVTCLLHVKYLTLKNGYRGYLKKGMTVAGRFIVANRSIWQLMYDKMDNWMNPNLLTI